MDYRRDADFGGFVWPRLTPGVKLLLIINGVVFLVNAILRGALSEWLGLSWSGLLDGYGLGLLRLISYQFVHSFVDPLHILFNMLFLYFFGGRVEEMIGKRKLINLYLTAGVVGGVVQLLLGRILGTPPTIPTVGASGAVYGIMVYAACLEPRARVIFIVFPIELRWLVGFLVAMGLYQTYVSLALGVSGGVAHGGHLGGALWGYLAYRLPRQRWRWLEKLQSWRSDRDTKSRRQKQEILDQLLDKVHREGIGSLSAAERRFLDKTSQEMRRR